MVCILEISAELDDCEARNCAGFVSQVFEVPFGNVHQKWFPAIGMRTEQTATSVLISDMNMNIWMDHPLHPLPHCVPQAVGGTRADGGPNDAVR